jgi:hypothetical protein
MAADLDYLSSNIRCIQSGQPLPTKCLAIQLKASCLLLGPKADAGELSIRPTQFEGEL